MFKNIFKVMVQNYFNDIIILDTYIRKTFNFYFNVNFFGPKILFEILNHYDIFWKYLRTIGIYNYNKYFLYFLIFR